MKKLLLSMALVACAQIGFAQSGKLHVQANLAGLTDSVVVLSVEQGNRQLGTFAAKDGKFDFDVDVDHVQDIVLATPATLRRQESKFVSFVAVPGESVELTGNIAERYDFAGSKFYRQYHEADLAMENAQKELIEYTNGLQQRLQAGESEEAIGKEYREKWPAMRDKLFDALTAYIRQHPDQEASAALIPSFKNDVAKMEEAAGMLTADVKNGRMKPYYQGAIDRIKSSSEREQAAARKQEAGVTAPDFTLNDINGKPLSLSSLRGKYVLLDFWGSWCIWCIKGFPQMKEYYNKYKGKFEILGIDCNDPEQKWKDAVKKHELPWLHVYNPRDSKVLEDYGIQGFPTKILVGPDGKIVKTVVGEDPAFYTFLDETFGK